MKTCPECFSQVFDLYRIPDGRELCDFCSTVALIPVKTIHIPREYNNTKWHLRRTYGSIANWARKHNLSTAQVNKALNTCKAENEDDYSDSDIRVFTRLIQSGIGQYLLDDGYITKEWL